ncbi:hypothetical protein RIF29_34950 [Crotalaria pallida]|uniref:Uncharacterized protein n=1 Tax=Crotalaria pallida TaxID=3830 RepID=A0AAN9EF69_CROPI
MEAVDKRMKKKRVTIGDAGDSHSDRLKKLKAEEDGGAAGGSGDGGSETTAVVPAEEEVEEFYAILRRMRVAVKYFDEKGSRGGKEWREVLEQAEVTVVDDDENVVNDDGHREAGFGAVKNNKGDDEVMIVNEGLDLNAAAPEADDGGDA